VAVTIRTEHRVDASPDSVWELLTDFPRFPEWNPLHRRIRSRGPLRPGTKITISLKMGNFRSIHGARLTTFDPERREFGWVAQAGLVPGLVVVERSFRVEADENGGARLVQDERDSGFGVPLLFAGGRFERRIRQGFDALADAIRARLVGDAATTTATSDSSTTRRQHER